MIVKIDRQSGQYEYYECKAFEYDANRTAMPPETPVATIPHYMGLIFNDDEVARQVGFNVAYIMENGKTVDVIRPLNG